MKKQISKKWSLKALLGLFLLSGVLFQFFASAQVPFPREGKFDLASGEAYELVGWIQIRPDGRLEFLLDLAAQPWLATRARIANPAMRLDGLTAYDLYIGKRVNLKVMAEGHMDLSRGCEQPGTYETTLRVSNNPQIQQ